MKSKPTVSIHWIEVPSSQDCTQTDTLQAELALDDLEFEERHWVEWFRALPTVEQLAVKCYITRGDLRLILFLWDRLLDHTK